MPPTCLLFPGEGLCVSTWQGRECPGRWSKPFPSVSRKVFPEKLVFESMVCRKVVYLYVGGYHPSTQDNGRKKPQKVISALCWSQAVHLQIHSGMALQILPPSFFRTHKLPTPSPPSGFCLRLGFVFGSSGFRLNYSTDYPGSDACQRHVVGLSGLHYLWS